MEDLESSHPIRGFNIILAGISGYLVTDLVMPNILTSFSIGSAKQIGILILIFTTIFGVIKWGLMGILGTIRGQKIEISAKYEFIGLLLSIPLLIFINKILVWIKVTNKNYDKKIKTDY